MKQLYLNFNPIIVLFLTTNVGTDTTMTIFQSYYSLIFNEFPPLVYPLWIISILL